MDRRLLPFASIGVVAAGVAWAQPTGQGLLNAVAFEGVPAKVGVQVRVLDDSQSNLAIKQQLEQVLAAQGVAVAEGAAAPLILTIEAGEAGGAFTAPGRTDQLNVRDDRGRLFPQGELDVSRFGQFPLRGTTVVTPPQYRVDLTLDDRARGTRLWQGWASAALSQGEPAELAAAMVPKLARHLGETVREESFPLQ